LLDRELIEQLYSSKSEVKRVAVYRLLFDRRYDMLDELKKAATFEKNEEMAVFMVQVCLTLENFPRDFSLERRIVELLQKPGGVVSLSEEMWKYLETHGSSQMLLATLGAMGDAIPPSAQDFIETCLTHPDPEIRAATCQKAIKSGRPTHFAFVLNLVTDPDPLVSQTAFMVIKELPGEELSIILDYALGSPDEWVLNNVAPFLPLIINNSVRKVIAKVSYHKHPMIAKKAREALKQLDAIPFISKRKAEAEAAAAAEKTAEEDEESGEGESGEDGEKKLSLKEQMELKRQQKLEEETKRKAEEDALAAELATVKPEDLDALAGEINRFSADPGDLMTEGADRAGADHIIADDQTFSENTSFENETRVLDDLEFDDDELEKALAQTVVSTRQASGSNTAVVKALEEEIITLDPKTIDLEKAQAQFGQSIEKVSAHPVASTAGSDDVVSVIDSGDEDINILVVDETEVSKPAVTKVENEIAKDVINISTPTAAHSGKAEIKPHADSVSLEKGTASTGNSAETSETSVDKEASVKTPEASLQAAGSSRQAPVQPQSPSTAQPLPSSAATQAADKSAPADATREVATPTVSSASAPETVSAPSAASSTVATVKTPVAEKAVAGAKPSVAPAGTQKPPAAAPQAKPAAAAPGARPVLPPEAREIAARYPSFLVDPFVQLFVPASNEARLAQIGQVLDNLTAFLNLCYLQSCLFFAPESEMLARSIIECIKGELVGPTALRCLHNFVLSMKQASGSPVFFTFSLAGVLSDTSDSNPLMMMRELKEYLREPAEPLDESVPQAVEGMTEILRGVKSVVNNLLVMKAPPGAKEPFADLSGPEARILPLEKRPGLDVPVGEVVLISRDGSEALGLFPYFKYSRKKVVFAKPSIEERNILLERLEIPADEF